VALRRQKVQQAAWRLRAGQDWQDRGLVFTTHEGNPLRRFDVAKVLRQAVHRAGLPQATMHTLRHLAASLALQEGVPLPLVSRALGHANVGITAAVYSHAIGQPGLVSAALDRALYVVGE
jgi:integrase